MTLYPVNNLMLVEPLNNDTTKTKGGILLHNPEGLNPPMGKVLDAGVGFCYWDEEGNELWVTEGDTVVYSFGVSTKYTPDISDVTRVLHLVDIKNILGVIPNAGSEKD